MKTVKSQVDHREFLHIHLQITATVSSHSFPDFFLFIFYSTVCSGKHPGPVKQRRVCDDERFGSGAAGAGVGTRRVG